VVAVKEAFDRMAMGHTTVPSQDLTTLLWSVGIDDVGKL